VKLTDLERLVLTRIAHGLDPWGGQHATSASRVVRQAVNRLRRKGALFKSEERQEGGWVGWGPYWVTRQGMDAIKAGSK
jgi:hypothetical protein